MPKMYEGKCYKAGQLCRFYPLICLPGDELETDSTGLERILCRIAVTLFLDLQCVYAFPSRSSLGASFEMPSFVIC